MRLLFCLWLALIKPCLLFAGGYYSPDFGTKRLGMMAVIANPEDPTAIYHNPAAMAGMKGTHLYHGQVWSRADTGLRLYDSKGKLWPVHEISPDFNLGISPFFGMVTDLGTNRLRIGLAAFAPNAFGAFLPKNEPSRYHVTDAIFVAGRSTLALSWDFSRQFTAGLSFSLMSVYLSAKRLMNPMVLDNPDMRFADPKDLEPMDFHLHIEGFDLGWTMDAALWYRPTPGLKIGAVFGKGSMVDLEGKAILTRPDGGKDKSTHLTRIPIPFQLQGGISWEFVPNFEVAMDVRYWHYQVFVEQRSILSPSLMGQDELVEPKNYQNSIAWSLGLGHRVTPSLFFMIGFQRDHSAVPERSISLENPVPDRTGISTGVRWDVSPSLTLGLALLRNWFDMIDNQQSVSTIPTNVKGHGGTTSLALDLNWRL